MTEQTTSKSKRRFAREPKATNEALPAPAATATSTASKKPGTQTKISTVIALLERDEGATLGQMIEVTGWLPHTTRAALTGLKKKGYMLARSERDGASVYRITSSPE